MFFSITSRGNLKNNNNKVIYIHNGPSGPSPAQFMLSGLGSHQTLFSGSLKKASKHKPTAVI
jgi:hypothetical protein